MTDFINEFNNKNKNKDKNKNTITMPLRVKDKQLLKNYDKIWGINWKFNEYRFWQQTLLWWYW